MVELFTFIAALLLLLFPITDWTATFILRRANKLEGGNNTAIKERSRIAFILAVSSTFNAYLASVRLFDLHPGIEVIRIMLYTSLILSSIPNLYWLYLYTNNRFRK